MVKLEQLEEAEDAIGELKVLGEQQEEAKGRLEDSLKSVLPDFIMSDYEAVTNLSKNLNINKDEARVRLFNFPKEYTVDGQSIPDLVKKMRKARRQMKGENRDRMSKSIDTIIDGYTDYLGKCIDSIFWIKAYKDPLLKMNFKESDLGRLNKIDSVQKRREVVDLLCKYWECDLKQNGMAYSKEYASLEKEMRLSKKEFRAVLKELSNSIKKTKKEKVSSAILKIVCEHPSIGTGQIYDRLPMTLSKSVTQKMIPSIAKNLNIAIVDEGYYKMPDELKKNIWAYTAAFIDSDGYITLDRSMNPRVGLVATGSRGKAFMNEMHKSIGFGRLHLDQKSPQDTRLINRLNFYSQKDVSELLTKCLPHFRLKKGNAKLLLELIRMKKSYKKADWYKGRCDEIFKLMKWENHKDHVGFDWLKENIYLDDIQKYKDNCKMSLMDETEQVGGMIMKEVNS